MIPALSSSARPGAPAESQLISTRAVDLDNGIRVLVHRRPGAAVVAARAEWRGGSLLESAATAGVSALLAALVTSRCAELGTDVAASAGPSSFGVGAEWNQRNWQVGLDGFLDCVLEPALSDAALDRERARLVADAERRAGDPSQLAFRLFVATLYGSHPYGLDELGTAHSLGPLTTAAVAELSRRDYPVAQMTLAIVGDIDPDLAEARARARLGRASARLAPDVVVEPAVFAGRPPAAREVYRYFEVERAHVVVGFPGTRAAGPDRSAIELLATVLDSRLATRRDLFDRVGADWRHGIDTGFVAVHAALAPEATARALAVIRAAIDDLRVRPVDRGELRRAVAKLTRRHLAMLESRAELAAALAFSEAHGLGWATVFDRAARLGSLGPADLGRVATRFLDWDLAVTATVTPPHASPEVIRRAAGSRRRGRR